MEFLRHLESLLSNKLGIAKDLFKLFKLEARLAGMSVFPLLLSLSLVIAFVLTLWLTFMLLIGDLILILTQKPLLAIASLLVMNLILTLFFVRILKQRLEQISFARTRACLKKPQERNERGPGEESIITINCRTRNEG